MMALARRSGILRVPDLWGDSVLVLDFVGRHGLAVYIICVLIFFVVSGLAQRVSQGSDTPLPKFKTWFLMQLATLFLFGAFAGLVGHVPWPLILASLGVSFGGFLIIKLLASLAGSALEISSRDIKKLQAVVFAEHVIVMSILGFGFIASLVVNISLLIWSGFAYDPALTASPL